MIDWNIRIGDIAVVASLALTSVGYAIKFGKITGVIETMQEQMKDLKGVVTTLAVQKERLDSQSKRLNVIDERIEDLRNGRGYVMNRKQRGVGQGEEY